MRKLVFKSSAHYYGCERDDPSFFSEDMQRPHPPRTRLERDIVEAEKAVAGFAERNRDVTVTTLRFCNGLGPDLRTSHTALLSLPVVPAILGFDPRYQFIHEDDIVGALEHARARRPAGRLQRGRRRRTRAVGDREPAGEAVRAGAAAVGPGLRRPALRGAGLRLPAEMRQPAALRAGPGQPQAQGRGLSLRARRRARPC